MNHDLGGGRGRRLHAREAEPLRARGMEYKVEKEDMLVKRNEQKGGRRGRQRHVNPREVKVTAQVNTGGSRCGMKRCL